MFPAANTSRCLFIEFRLHDPFDGLSEPSDPGCCKLLQFPKFLQTDVTLLSIAHEDYGILRKVPLSMLSSRCFWLQVDGLRFYAHRDRLPVNPSYLLIVKFP